MKNLFSFNIEEANEGTVVSTIAKPYILREVNDSISKNQKKISDKMEELEKKWLLPTWLSYTKVIAMCIGAMLLSCAIMILLGVGFAPAFSSPLFIVGLIFGVLLFGFGLACFIYEYKKRTSVENSDDYKKAMEYIDKLSRKSENYLSLPENKVKVDVFFYPYILRDGKQKDNSAFKYLNMSLYLFEEDGILCLANNSTVYGVKKELFERILQEPKKTSFSVWNKDKSHASEEFKEYKIALDHYGVYRMRNVCSIRFKNEDGFSREIVVPPYEICHFEKILGLKVKENEEETEEE